MQKKISVNGKEYTVREMLNIEAQNLPKVVETMTKEEQEIANKESVKQETMMCANITSEQYDALTYKEYLTLRQAILQLNTPEKDFWVAN
jgi:hypothetical protein